MQHVPSHSSEQIYIAHNRRDKTVFDFFAVNLSSGEETLIFENSEQVINLLVSDAGDVKARLRQTDDERLLQVPDRDRWRTIQTAGKLDAIYPVSLTQDATQLYALSNVNHDKLSVVLIDLQSGRETLIFQHSDVDVQQILSRKNSQPLLAKTEFGYPQTHFFKPAFKHRLTPYTEQGTSGLRVMSLDRNETKATLAVYDHTGATFLLVDLKTGTHQTLGESALKKNAEVLVTQTPITFSARDGMLLHGYLSVPTITSSAAPSRPINRELPTAVFVHGGPWARDSWGYNTEAQFLANRGYAVLQINYRGSGGYGRDYTDSVIGNAS